MDRNRAVYRAAPREHAVDLAHAERALLRDGRAQRAADGPAGTGRTRT